MGGRTSVKTVRTLYPSHEHCADSLNHAVGGNPGEWFVELDHPESDAACVTTLKNVSPVPDTSARLGICSSKIVFPEVSGL